MAAGHAVKTLATVDPVGWFRPDFDLVAKFSGEWINYNSVGTGISWPNFIATIGGAWNDTPYGYADFHYRMKLDHVSTCYSFCEPGGMR